MRNTRTGRLAAAALVLACIVLPLGALTLVDCLADRSGWVTENGLHYYTDARGIRLSGWQELGGRQYYFGLSRAMHTGWLEADAGRYYFDPDGVMHTGWLEADAGRYYFDPDGRAHTGWLELEGRRYLLGSDGRALTGWQSFEGSRFYLAADGSLHTGWLDTDAGRCWLDESGQPVTGWRTLEEKQYWFGADGILHTGWLTQEAEYRYWFDESGVMATGPRVIDGRQYYFTPKGIQVTLVNRHNPVPGDYRPELVAVDANFSFHILGSKALAEMIAACNAAGYPCQINSTYRSEYEQQWILSDRTSAYMQERELTYEQARWEALQSVALPGTSEHHLGLAVDFNGIEPLQWLREHCWEYGFILRYPEGKTNITGIIYEPWHFRYVGTRVSLDMQHSGLCLEEYLGAADPA